MDFRKLGEQVGRLRETAKEKVGDRAEPENLKRDAKEFREILAGDGSLAEKAREAREKLSDRDGGSAAAGTGETTGPGEAAGPGETAGPGGGADSGRAAGAREAADPRAAESPGEKD